MPIESTRYPGTWYQVLVSLIYLVPGTWYLIPVYLPVYTKRWIIPVVQFTRLPGTGSWYQGATAIPGTYSMHCTGTQVVLTCTSKKWWHPARYQVPPGYDVPAATTPWEYEVPVYQSVVHAFPVRPVGSPIEKAILLDCRK